MKTEFPTQMPRFFPFWVVSREDSLWHWYERQRQRIALSRLDDRLLRDVGLTQMAARREWSRYD